jgi:peptide/nickel transport system substrate-binding protein
MYTHRTLLRLDLESLSETPLLLTQLPQTEDGKTFIYTIKDGATWDDGTPLTVEDVLFSIKLNVAELSDNGGLKNLYRSVIKNAYPLENDSNSFVLECVESHAGNAQILSECWILQRSLWDADNVLGNYTVADLKTKTEFNESESAWFDFFNSPATATEPQYLTGLGPYRVEKWEKGQFLKLVKKENWWGENSNSLYDQNHPGEIIFRFMEDDNAALLALKKGEIDVTDRISTEDYLQIRETEDFQNNFYSKIIERFGYTFLGLNNRPDGVNHLPYFEDKLVRKAMAYLTPVEDILSTIYSNVGGVRVSTMISPMHAEMFNDTIPFIPVNIEKANQLLDEAGWTDTDGDGIRDKVVNGERIPFRFNLNFISQRGSIEDMAIMIAESMRKAGIEAVPQALEFSTFYQKAYAHDFDALLGAWSMSAGYTDHTQLWSTDAWKSNGSNFLGFGNALSDSLIRISNTALEPQDRNAALKELQAVIYDETPCVFIFAPRAIVIVSKKFDQVNFYSERPYVAVNTFERSDNYVETEIASDSVQTK